MLTDPQIERFSRQIILPQIGARGQVRLLASRVLFVHLGPAASTTLAYLSAAGIGELGLVDEAPVSPDDVRGAPLAHCRVNVGQPRPEAAARLAAALHPEVRTAAFADPGAALAAGSWSLAVFGSSEAAAACNRGIVSGRVPGLVVGDMPGHEGWLAGIAGHLPEVPCFACATPDLHAAAAGPPHGDGTPPEVSCLAGIMGTLTAIEAVKLILGIGTPVLGRILTCDPDTLTTRIAPLTKDPHCPVCAAPRGSPSLPA